MSSGSARREAEVRAAEVSFMGVALRLGADVLVPRAETELLGRSVLEILAGRPGPQAVVDMCCGCGNLALAVAAHHPQALVFASDLTEATVATARENAERLALAERVRIVQGDLFSGLAGEGLEGGVDIVMCNPPYISTTRLAGDRAHLLEAEPREAFDGGPYGISIMQRLVIEALPFLREGGWIAFEFGLGQERQTKLLLDRARGYGPVEFRSDAEGAPRVALARKRATAA
jgi:release factor glutamine methyltransferase